MAKYWKWILVTLVFVALVFLHPRMRLVGLVRSQRSLNRMEREIEMYKAQIKADSLFLENLDDDDFLEKYAREKFYMRTEDEQVFIFE